MAICAAVVSGGCAHDPRLWVRNLRFVGVKSVRAGDLRDQLATRETSWFTIRKKRWFARSALAEDEKRIAGFYAQHGWFGAHVISRQVKPRRNNSVDVTITVDEGQPTHIVSVGVQ